VICCSSGCGASAAVAKRATDQFSAYKEAGVEVTDVIPISDERVAPPSPMLKTTQKGSPPISTSQAPVTVVPARPPSSSWIAKRATDQFSAYKEAGVEVTDVIPISDERVAPPQAWAGVICPIETRYWTSE
jgi:hypothetical protein